MEKQWMKLAEKGSFPVLLQQLCDQKSSSNSEAGFRGTGLWPFDPNTIRKSCNVQDHDDSSTQLGLCTSQEALVGDTSQKLLGMVIIANIHRVHWGINPPSKTPPPLFHQVYSKICKSASLPLLGNAPYILLFFCGSP